MCIICYKPAGKILPMNLLEDCFDNNSDGAGFAIIEKDDKGADELNIYKGIFDWETFLKAWEPHQDKQAILHFRVASYNKVINGDNCHPFRVNENLVMAHNGFISGVPCEANLSDTAIFCRDIIKPLSELNPDFWQLPQMEWFIENAIGKKNKLVLMDVSGKAKIFNASEGHWYLEAWFSNYSYLGTQYRHNNSPVQFALDNRDKKYSGEPELTEPNKETTKLKVIDVEAEIVTPNTNSRATQTDANLSELEALEAEFPTHTLAEIDRRLEQAQNKFTKV